MAAEQRKLLNCLERYFLKTRTYHCRESSPKYTVLNGSHRSVKHSNLLVWVLPYRGVVLFHPMSQQRAPRTPCRFIAFCRTYLTVTTNFRVEALAFRCP